MDISISTTIPATCVIEADIYCNNIWAWFLEIAQSDNIGVSGWSMGNAYSSAQNNTWYHFKAEIKYPNSIFNLYDLQGTHLGSSTKSSNSNVAKMLLKTRDTMTELRFKNLLVYTQ